MNQIRGKHALLEALKSGHKIHQITLCEGMKHDEVVNQILFLAARHKIPVKELRSKEFNSLYPDKGTQHVVASSASITPLSLNEMIDRKEEFESIVLLDHIEDPHNMGAILRSCEALGVSAVIYPKDRQATLNPTVIKTSAGAIYHLTLVQVTNTTQAATKLRDNGYWLYGAEVHNGVDLEKARLNSPWVLVVGNEQKGISKPIQKLLHQGLTIPMKGNIDSLNVSVATGILLYALSQNQ